MHHPTDRITHTTAFVAPVVEHWLEREILNFKKPNDKNTNWQADPKLTRHSAKYCCIDIWPAIGCAHHHDIAGLVGDQAIPEAHELSLYHGRCFVIRRRT